MDKMIIILAATFLVPFTQSILEIIPERAGIDFYDRQYFQFGRFNVRKTGRGGIYVVNLDFVTNHTFSNNLTVDLIFYQFLHNEYRRSFVEMHFKLCDMINNDPFAGRALLRAGIKCPVTPGRHTYNNMTFAVPEVENMKWVFPFEKCKVMGNVNLPAINKTIATGFLALTLKQVQKKPKN